MNKFLSTTVAVSILTTLALSPAYATIGADVLPSFKDGTNVDVSTNGKNMNVQVNADKYGVGTAHWNNFNVGKDASVNFEFTNHHQTALNIVEASGGMSQIYGKLTNSGCANCGYEGTGKVILLNPNGVLFGESANVNLNSFTVSDMKGDYDKDKSQLKLTKGSSNDSKGIVVLGGANIHGDKNVTMASDKGINIYSGSKISTNTGINGVGKTTAYGKVKLVTADGVNFTYYNNGGVQSVSDPVSTNNLVGLKVQGDIQSGQIDIRNYSNHEDASVNLYGATLKATKATMGNDGNIYLTANNKVIVDKSTLQTVNAEGAESRDGGKVVISANNKASVKTSNINAVGDVNITSNNHDAVIETTKITTPKDVNIKAGKIASVQYQSDVNAKNVNITGTDTRAQIVTSKVNADNVTLNGKELWFSKSDVTANNKITGTATGGDVTADGRTKFKAGDEIKLTAAGSVKGDMDVQKSLTKLYADDEINVTLDNVDNRQKGLVAEAENDVTITTDGTLSVGRLITRKGDMTLNADKVIAGLPYTDEEKIPGDDSPRSYIYVKHGTFTSNTKNDNFEVTASDRITEDGKHKERHHIQYGNGAEKILLINDRPFTVDEPVTPPQMVANPDVNADQASLMTRIPRQPEAYNPNTVINNNRTDIVDVFAAASQIEIEEDEEE